MSGAQADDGFVTRAMDSNDLEKERGRSSRRQARITAGDADHLLNSRAQASRFCPSARGALLFSPLPAHLEAVDSTDSIVRLPSSVVYNSHLIKYGPLCHLPNARWRVLIPHLLLPASSTRPATPTLAERSSAYCRWSTASSSSLTRPRAPRRRRASSSARRSPLASSTSAPFGLFSIERLSTDALHRLWQADRCHE